MLFVNNLEQNGSNEQRSRFLPSACEGSTIAGMCMSEPGAGERIDREWLHFSTEKPEIALHSVDLFSERVEKPTSIRQVRQYVPVPGICSCSVWCLGVMIMSSAYRHRKPHRRIVSLTLS